MKNGQIHCSIALVSHEFRWRSIHSIIKSSNLLTPRCTSTIGILNKNTYFTLHMEVSINGGNPSYHPFSWDVPLGFSPSTAQVGGFSPSPAPRRRRAGARRHRRRRCGRGDRGRRQRGGGLLAERCQDQNKIEVLYKVVPHSYLSWVTTWFK